MDTFSIIVIGASAGGVEALSTLFRSLPSDLNAAIFVVLHLTPNAKSYLPDILARHCLIPVSHAKNGDAIEKAHAYIAPPDHHLILKDGVMRLSFGPRINHTRPAIDPLFQTAAAAYGERVVGVILSGSLSDGTKGLLSIKRAGGIAIVQDPDEAMFPSMPESALQSVPVDYTLSINKISDLLKELADQRIHAGEETKMNEEYSEFSKDETALIRADIQSFETGHPQNQRSVLTCPECGGVLWEIVDEKLVRYRCHTGHIYDADNLIPHQAEEIEKGYWTLIRLMTEQAAALNRLAVRARADKAPSRERFFLAQAKAAENRLELLRAAWTQANNAELPATGPDGHPGAGEQANDNISDSLGSD